MTDIIWNYGGGLQSIRILTLIADKKIQKPTLAIMVDTGYERQSTWDYHNQYSAKIMADLGIELHIVPHSLSIYDLYSSSGKLLLPAFTERGKLPTFCSANWKRNVSLKYVHKLNYGRKKPFIQWFGMSLDEISRMVLPKQKYITNHYPLIFDYKQRKHECKIGILEFGLPVPKKSSCYICPHLQNYGWADIRDNYPQDFKKAITVDNLIRNKGEGNPFFLHFSRTPLDKADLTTNDELLPMEQLCAATCWT